jgi:tRNA threonylcarbamoyladenosine biosynthesis protein TsaB
LEILRITTSGPVIFAGEGTLRYREVISARMDGQAIFAGFPQQTGLAANGALLALDQYRKGLAVEPARLLPVYIRASEAEYAKTSQQGPRKTAQFLPL